MNERPSQEYDSEKDRSYVVCDFCGKKLYCCYHISHGSTYCNGCYTEKTGAKDGC